MYQSPLKLPQNPERPFHESESFVEEASAKVKDYLVLSHEPAITTKSVEASNRDQIALVRELKVWVKSSVIFASAKRFE